MNYLWKNLTKEEEINLSADELLLSGRSRFANIVK